MAIKISSIAMSASNDDVLCNLSSLKLGNKKIKNEKKKAKLSNT